jgi:hypothetical protein
MEYKFLVMSERDAAGELVAADGGLDTGGSADGGAMGDAGVGTEAKGGEAKADRPSHYCKGDRMFSFDHLYRLVSES